MAAGGREGDRHAPWRLLAALLLGIRGRSPEGELLRTAPFLEEADLSAQRLLGQKVCVRERLVGVGREVAVGEQIKQYYKVFLLLLLILVFN